MTKFFRLPTLCALVLCLAVPAAGQGRVRDYNWTKEANPALSLGNAASLSEFTGGAVSSGTLSFSKENGALIALDGSPDSWSAGVGTESFRRVSEKLVFSGAVKYEYFRGNSMGAQVLLDPYDSPVNFLEEDYSTSGVKKRESYLLRGAFSYSLSESWSLGLKLDYEAADRTKYKDPRFQNDLMDLSVSPGIWFRASDFLGVGINMLYRHRLEQIKAKTYGTIDRQYYLYVDYGGFIGQKEEFNGDMGYVSLSNARPLADDYYGGAVQLILGRTIKLFNRLSGYYRKGSYGTRSSSSVVFCECNGPLFEYSGVFDLPSGTDWLHRVSINAVLADFYNFTNSFYYNTEDGMATEVVYIGNNRTLFRRDMDISFAYGYYVGTDKFRPDWVLRAEADLLSRAQRTTVFPIYRDYRCQQYSASLGAERNLNFSRSVLGIAARVSFNGGAGTPSKDGKTADGASRLKSYDDYLNRQFEFDTAACAGTGIELTYTWTAFFGIAPYIKLSEEFRSLLAEPQYLDGRSRNVALVTLGCSF